MVFLPFYYIVICSDIVIYNIAVILVYDVTSSQSFDHLNDWLEEVDLWADEDDTIKLLVGNKVDLQDKLIQRQQGLDFAKTHAMVFIETSAKTEEGIQQTFDEVITKVLENPRLNAQTKPKEKSAHILDGSNDSNDQESCC